MTYLSILERLAKAEDIQAEWQHIVPKSKRKKAVESIYKWIHGNWQFSWSSKRHEETKLWYMPKGHSSINKEGAIKLFKFFFVPKQTVKTYYWE